MTAQYGAEQQRRQQPPQLQQQQQGQDQRQDGSHQSQSQGGRRDDAAKPTTADPGADGRSVYDVQEEETRQREAKPVPPPWNTRPDSNAM